MSVRRGFSLVEVLIALGIIAILLALLLPAIQMVRSAAIRSQCGNNLRQIGLALHQYHDTYHCFPPGMTDLDGGWTRDNFQFLSWESRIMPYLEQEAYWKQALHDYELMPLPHFPPYHSMIGQLVAVFECPSDGRVLEPQRYPVYDFEIALSSYLGVNGIDGTKNDGVLFANSRTRLTEIKDGTSNTLLVGERPPSNDFRFGWLYFGGGQKDGVCDLTLGVQEIALPISGCPSGPYHFQQDALGIPCAFMLYWSLHSGGAQFLFSDGSVHFLSYSAEAIMPLLATRAGGEVVELP